MVHSGYDERRGAQRYFVLGHAHLFASGRNAERARVADVSEVGCRVLGVRGLQVGQRVLLSLDLEGLPHMRLPATVVRANEDGSGSSAAVRFEVPRASTDGFERWLVWAELEHVQPKILKSSRTNEGGPADKS